MITGNNHPSRMRHELLRTSKLLDVVFLSWTLVWLSFKTGHYCTLYKIVKLLMFFESENFPRHVSGDRQARQGKGPRSHQEVFTVRHLLSHPILIYCAAFSFWPLTSQPVLSSIVLQGIALLSTPCLHKLIIMHKKGWSVLMFIRVISNRSS